MKSLTVREAALYERLGDGRIRCGVCERRCAVMPSEVGFCRTRKNTHGRLYTLIYGDISSISANPIEKKPFYHFWPGSRALTVGSWSCNFTCPWCQNWSISKFPPDPERANYISPERFVEMTVANGCQGTSVSFNEPTLMLEWSADVFGLARRRNLYNTFVSNGYMTVEALRLLAEAGLDALNVDVKGGPEAVRRYCGADVEVVWRNIREARRLGLHLEVVNLVIPGVNDSEDDLREMARKCLREAGEEVPLHFTSYYPAYEFSAPPTPVETLERAYEIAKEEGLKFVYVGNIPGHKYESTYCPECGRMLIRRFGFEVVEVNLKGYRCGFCGAEIPLVGEIRVKFYKL
jgi:pyruvate formate lyase activating enzyme